MSNQPQKSEINCPMNVVFYAQVVFKKLIFQARGSHQVFMGNLSLSFRRWDFSSILCFAVSPDRKYRSEPSFYFHGLCFK